jgi:hypothetical protein
MPGCLHGTTRIARAEQKTEDSQKRIDRTVQPEQDTQKRTGRTEQTDQDQGLSGQGCEHRAARIGLLG